MTQTCRITQPVDRIVKPWHRHTAAVGLALVLLATSVVLYACHNDFPAIYHPDEYSKVSQVLAHDRNYRHPMLLLECTERVMQWLDTPQSPRDAVLVGRWVSASMGGLAVVAMAYCGYVAAGLLGMFLCGCAVMLCPILLTNAHYMKEDSALAFGVALSMLGTRLVWKTSHGWTTALAAAFLGFGCAIAAAGKYIGITSAAVALPILVFATPRRWGHLVLRLLIFPAFLVGSWVVINYRIYDDYDRFRQSLDGEYEHSQSDHSGIAMPRPNTFAWHAFFEETPTHVLVLVGAYVAMLVISRRDRTGWDVLMICSPVIWLVVVSYCVIPFNRYALPAVMIASFLAALGAAWIVRHWGRSRPWRIGLTILAIGVVIGAPLSRCLDYLQQFGDDSRERFRQWAIVHLPRHAVVLQDAYVSLDNMRTTGRRPLPGREDVTIVTRASAMSEGTIEELRQRGIEYIAVCDISYARFLYPQTYGVEAFANVFAVNRARYQRLFRDFPCIWESVPRYPIRAFTNPTIRLYQITPSGDQRP